jgi:2-aminoadipate transaminase
MTGMTGMTANVLEDSPPRLARRAGRLVSSQIRDLLRLAEQPGIASLAGGLPDGDTFAVDRLTLASERALRVRGRYGATALQYAPTEGLSPLRELVASGGAAHPALGDPATTIVTTGSQQGLDLIARVLVDPGDTVVVEDPVYLGARQALLAAGARLVGTTVDDGGLDVDALAERLRAGLRPRLVYIVPHFQNPTGATLAPARRARVAELATRYGFVVVEDDPYAALGFDGRRHDPIGALAPDHVVTLGSASKVLAPGLRIGWLRAPSWLCPAIVLAKQSADLHTPAFNQLIVLDVLGDEPFLRGHLARLRAAYAEKAAALHEAVAGSVECTPPAGGMFLWGTTPCDTTRAFASAVAAGVAYVPGAAFAVGDTRAHARSLRLSYATLPPDELRGAGERLRAALIPG